MQLAVIDPVTHRWTGEWGPTVKPYVAPTLASLRASSRYHIVSDAQLKRDLKGRALADVYRENRALRGVERRYVPRATIHGAFKRSTWANTEYGDMSCGGLELGHETVKDEYLAWCKARNHTPHPASIDGDHPMHAGQREKCPRREIV